MSEQSCGQCSAGPGEPCEPYYCTCYDCIKQQESSEEEEARLDERARICEWLDSESKRLTENHNRTSDIIAHALAERAEAIRHGYHEEASA